MKIEIDSRRYIESKDRRWLLQGHPVKRSYSRDKLIRPLDCGHIWKLSEFLLTYGVPFSVFGDRAVLSQATALGTAFKSEGATRVAFGGGRFVIEKGQGDFHLLNPTMDVARLRDTKRGQGKVHVGYFPSIASALLAALERTLQADPRTIDLHQFDRVITGTATKLWVDVTSECPTGCETVMAGDF